MSDYLVVDKTRLLAFPTSGAPWTKVKSVADGSMGTVALADQNSTTAGKTLAAALVAARTGSTAHADKTRTVLAGLPTASLANARVLSVARQVAGFVLAADLIGYRDPKFVQWVDTIRWFNIGGHSRWYTIKFTSEDSANNWGGWAMASRIAASAYLADTTDLGVCATIVKGYSDRTAYAGFRKTADFDPTWATDATNWTPVNPAGFPGKSGACVEDISRSAGTYPTVDDTGRTYSWEFIGGWSLSCRVLSRAGHPNAYQWGDSALRRAGEFLASVKGYPPLYSVNQYIPWEINNAYGITLGPVNAAGLGRQFGFTDWIK
jgi:hypothetical protein